MILNGSHIQLMFKSGWVVPSNCLLILYYHDIIVNLFVLLGAHASSNPISCLVGCINVLLRRKKRATASVCWVDASAESLESLQETVIILLTVKW